MDLVIDVSVFIDKLFIYDKKRSSRTHRIFEIIEIIGHNIFEPQVFGIELISQLVRRKPKDEAKKIYEDLLKRVIIFEEIDYDTLLEIALETRV